MPKRRKLSASDAKRLAYLIVAYEIRATLCGDQVDEAVQVNGGTEDDTAAVQREIERLSERLEARGMKISGGMMP